MGMENNDWQTVKLGDYASFVTGKLDSNAAKPDGMYPFFTCSRETLRTDTYSFDTECVLLAGNNAAGIFSIKYFEGKFDAYQRTYIIEPFDRNKLSTRFLYYALQLQLEYMKSVSTGAATKFLTKTILDGLVLEIPEYDTQRKIAAILSAYDDLIENNNRRIQILEGMAQAIYREWFVNFHFPGHEGVKMVDSVTVLGVVPEVWDVQTLADVLENLESGSRPKGGINPDDTDVPSIGAENILGLGKYDFTKEKFVSSKFFEKMKRGIIKDSDVLLYKDGAKLGRKSLFRDGFPHDLCSINEHVFILRSNNRCTQSYLYFWLDLSNMTQAIINLNSNAAQPGINQAKVKTLPILIPDARTLNALEEIIEPILALLFNLAKKNIHLRATRDLLLPKLVSGNIDVSQLEITV